MNSILHQQRMASATADFDIDFCRLLLNLAGIGAAGINGASKNAAVGTLFDCLLQSGGIGKPEEDSQGFTQRRN